MKDEAGQNSQSESGGTTKEHPETAAGEKGGKEAASRQAERDWQDSAKESGD